MATKVIKGTAYHPLPMRSICATGDNPSGRERLVPVAPNGLGGQHLAGFGGEISRGAVGVGSQCAL
jgi:hypothetical protein